MPPKNNNNHHQPQRRDRKEALQQDIVNAIENCYSSSVGFAICDDRVLPILKDALNAGVDPNLKILTHEEPILCTFAWLGMMKCFEECLIFGANPSLRSNANHDALSSSLSPYNSTANMVRMVRVLMSHPNAIQFNFDFTLVTAARNNYIAPLRIILEKRPDLANLCVEIGVGCANETAAKLGFDNGAKLDFTAPSNSALLHVAARLPSSEICKLLLDNGANLEARDKAQETPFLVAVHAGAVECMKFLIDRGCDVNVKNIMLHDALTIAADNNRPESLKVLKEKTELAKSVFKIFWISTDRIIARNYVECFKVLALSEEIPDQIVIALVHQNRYEMLSYALLECSQSFKVMADTFKELLNETENEDIKKLLQVKIDMMNEIPQIKIKEEANEEEEEEEIVTKKKKPAAKKTAKKK